MLLHCRACVRATIGALSHCHEFCAPQGIKVRDAASKRAAKEAVKERRQAAGMEMDDE